MKKIVCFFLLATLLPLTTSSEIIKYGSLWYNLQYSSACDCITAEVVTSQDDPYSGIITIPQSFYRGETCIVTSIGNSAFEGCVDVTSVSIPSSVTSIGNAAFWQCSSLESVYIPEGVTTIGEGAFHNCFNLVSVVLPSSVTSIGSSAFSNCDNLSQVISRIQNPFSINNNVFTTYSTTTLVIPKDTKSAYLAKTGWKKFTNINDDLTNRTIHVATAGTLPDLIPENEMYQISGLTLSGELNGTDFYFIRKMAGIYFSVYGNHYNGGTEYISTEGVLKKLDLSNSNIVQGGMAYMATDDTFYTGGTITDIDWSYYYTIDNTISNLMFYGTKLESIDLPNSVTSIASEAFRCPLTSIVIPQTVTNIGKGVFSWCNSLTSIIVEKGNSKYDSRNNCNAIVESNSNKLIAGCKNTSIPNSVKSIGEGAFTGCRDLTSIMIPPNVASIGANAFSGCSGLTSVHITDLLAWCNINFGNNYISSAHHLYLNGIEIKDLVIPNSVTSIGEYTFQGCCGLTTISIPNSVTEIGANAFSGCSGLTNITIHNNVTSIGDNAFQNCSGLTTIMLPKCVTNMGSKVFSGCSGLASITIPNGVTAIRSYDFYGCSSLTSVKIPNSVTSIDKDAFYGTGWYNNEPNGILYLDNCLICYKGDRPSGSLVIKEGTRLLANDVFSWCNNLTSVSIPNSVTTIGSTFYFCSGLISVNIPNSVTIIGSSAFYGCSSLSSITIPNSVTTIGSYAFSDCSSITSITIPQSVTSIGRHAFLGTGWYKNQPNGFLYLDHCLLYYKGTNNLSGTYYIKEDTRLVADYVFESCSGLTSISIPNSVKSVGENSFAYTGWYNNQPDGFLYLDNCLLGYKGDKPNGALVIKDGTRLLANNSFKNCNGLNTISIPNSVTNIGIGAIYGTDWYNEQPFGLLYLDNCLIGYKGEEPSGSLVIKDGTRLLANDAFSWCNGLTSIRSQNCIPPSCETSSFHINVKENSAVLVPKGCSSDYKNADGWKNFKIIKELSLGDVNINGELNWDDLNNIVSFIMGDVPEDFDKEMADLNGDEAVNAADVVKLVTILNIQDGLSTDWQFNYNSSQVVSSLSCTLNNDGDKAIQLTKCELYNNNILVSSAKFNVTLGSGGSKSCTFNELSSFSTRTGFSVVWYYTYNGESYTYSCDLTE